jgi:hypothetical protein
MLSDDEAEEMLANNSWAKWSDARDLLLDAAHVGGKNTSNAIAKWLESQGHKDLADTILKRWG